MSRYNNLQKQLKFRPRKWLITGVAGFIGSNLLEALLKLDQRVNGLDNFSSGNPGNLEEVRTRVSPSQWARFHFFEGDIADLKVCEKASRRVEIVLHHAALASVPRSMSDPLMCHRSNVTGFLNMLTAACAAGVTRFVYASSSAVYGNNPSLPKMEGQVSQPLSPYGASKAVDEVYAGAFARAYGLQCIGLRYFNVFGPRQDPEGGYGAVIPKWIAALLKQEAVFINGDGKTSRDFCFIEDVIQANLLAGTTMKPQALNQVYNIALGHKTTLNQLFRLLKTVLKKQQAGLPYQKPIYCASRPGDIRHSVADIAKARRLLDYSPSYEIQAGLELAMDWYRKNVQAAELDGSRCR